MKTYCNLSRDSNMLCKDAVIEKNCGLTPVVEQVQVFLDDSHEHDCYLKGDWFKPIATLLNRSSGLLGMDKVYGTSSFACAFLYIVIEL